MIIAPAAPAAPGRRLRQARLDLNLQPTTSTSSRLLWPRVTVLLITLLVFAPSVSFEFNGWDDGMVLAENPRLLEPSVSSLRFYLSNAEHDLYIPLTQTAWWITAHAARVSGPDGKPQLNPSVFHLLNLLVHAAAAMACFQLLWLLTACRWPAAMGALIFAVHPLQVETVCWTAATKDLLAGALAIAALVVYGLHVRRNVAGTTEPWDGAGEFDGSGGVRANSIHVDLAVAVNSRYFAVASILALAAMLSKPSAVVLPLMALVIDRLLLRSPWRLVLLRTFIWLMLALPIVVLAKLAQPGHTVAMVPLPQRFVIAGDALAFYLWKLFWPLNLGFDYGRTPTYVIAQGWAWLTGAVPIMAAFVAASLWRRCAVIGIGLMLFAAALLPVLGLVPFDFQIYSTVGDHYVYLAMIGPALAAASFARLPHGAWVIALVIGAASILSARQMWTWRDLETMSVQALKVHPGSWASYNNLSAALAKKGEIGGAIAAGKAAVALRPDLKLPREALAGALVLSGDAHAAVDNRSAAIAAYKQALEALPTSALAWTNLAATYAEDRQYDAAIESYQKALEHDPSSAAARQGLEMAQKMRDQKP